MALPDGLEWNPETRHWLVRTQALADIVLRDPHVGTLPANGVADTDHTDEVPSVSRFFNLWYLRGANHPEVAPDLRRVYNAGPLAGFRPVLGKLAAERRARLLGSGNLVEDFVAPYCLDSTFALMGFAEEDWATLTKVYHVLMFAVRKRFRGERELGERAGQAFESALVFLRSALGRAQDVPLMQVLRAPAAHPWADVALVGQLLAAGVPQVTTGLAVGCHALLGRPEVLDSVTRGEVTVEQVAEEAMRIHPPFLTIHGWTTEGCDCLGVRLEPGTAIVVDVQAVNNDPARVDDPESFCPARGRTTTFTFGKGAHYCLGATSARYQIAEALGALAADPLRVDAAAMRVTSDPFSQTVSGLPYTQYHGRT
ncbi:cytochrome P450 [Nonomuraea sp. NPDC049400]|uniref:cytochrome P450 n=1 Tax=Nonomuraea sp. NPDC049400 TaxID=3364352 RepID=UPI0037B4DF04